MKSNNTKVNRTFSALACELQNLDNEKIRRIHNLINDKRDGYNYNFIAEVNAYRIYSGNKKPSI